jgi:hypothetical protein
VQRPALVTRQFCRLLQGSCDHLLRLIETNNPGRIASCQLAAHQAFAAAQIPQMQPADVTQQLDHAGSGGEVAE